MSSFENARFFFKVYLFFLYLQNKRLRLNLLRERFLMTKMRKSLLQFIFSGSSMRRWNDKLRPVELYEIDKQAHKMITAFLLYRLQCRNLDKEESLLLGQELIEGCLFDYFYRLIITDIKPPVFYRIRENKEHFEQLTNWVLTALEPIVKPIGQVFWDKLVAYHKNAYQQEEESLAQRILKVSHLYASKWEFNLIRPLNYFDEELRDIESSFTEQLQAMNDIEGVNHLLASAGNPFVRIANLCGQLRFQIRWSQTSRMPETSVLGHMFVVASYSYFMSLDLGLCNARAVNNFFAGLFHDLPELLTRDISNPVKKSVDYLPGINEYENAEIERRILVPLQSAGYEDVASRLSYYLGTGQASEFGETISDEYGNVHAIDSFEQLHAQYNFDKFDGKDGALVKACDMMGAFLEAHTSVHNGVGSPYIYEAMERIRTQCKDVNLGSFNIRTLLADFD